MSRYEGTERRGPYSRTERAAFSFWQSGHEPETLSVETHPWPVDKYGLAHFAQDDPQRFFSLLEHLSPRDQEILICFAILQKGPTDLSILFGKAGHRAADDLQKAAHKLAALAEFGPLPPVTRIAAILERHSADRFGERVSLSACLWQYARCRDFAELSSLIGERGLRQQMQRVCKMLHELPGREEGLLAGWILWLVDGSNPSGRGWLKRRTRGNKRKLGPRAFHSSELRPRKTGRGGKGQVYCTVKIRRQLKCLVRSRDRKANAEH